MEQSPVVVRQAPLSEAARVVDTFVAPSKTFTDILRSASWWMPFLLIVVVSVAWAFSIDKTVGFRGATEQQITSNPKSEARMADLTPDQRAHQLDLATKITRISTYGSPVFALIFLALEALILWGSFNFMLGASTTFGRVFAVTMYASLPRLLIFVLSGIFLFAGVGADAFDMRNPVGTNLGYYVHEAGWMKTAGTFFDLFGLWCLALLVIGMAIISGKKISQSATVVFGWFFLVLLIVTGFSAM